MINENYKMSEIYENILESHNPGDPLYDKVSKMTVKQLLDKLKEDDHELYTKIESYLSR